MTVLIDAQGINTHYGQSHILFDVNLQINAGESVGLLGRNGMGKSTLIRTLMGHLRPTAGNIKIRGKDQTKAEPHQVARQGEAYEPEGRGIFPNLDVRENLMVAARQGVNGRNDWNYERVLETFPRLTERLGHGGQQLSGGEQQMLVIGRSLMSDPELILMDEPSMGLAPIIVEQVFDVVRRISETGKTILLVEQNAALALSLANEGYVIELGTIVLSGEGGDLLRNPEVEKAYLGL